MSIKYKFTAILTIYFALTGCGGGGDDESPASMTDQTTETGTNSENTDNGTDVAASVLTGVFVDSAVEGMSYTTATQSGVTNSAGEFSYLAGEQVTFSIGAMQLPVVTAAPQVTPIEMAASTSNPTATTTNIARLLQSLDSDGNPDNGITISPTATANAAFINFNVSTEQFANDTNVINLVANSGSSTTSLISAADANAHLNDTLGINNEPTTQFTQSMLVGRTLIPFPIQGALQPHSVVRFNSTTDSFITGTPGGNLSDGNFPWSINADGLVTIDFNSFEAGTLFTLELEAIEGSTLTTQSTWQGIPDPIRNYTLSVPLSTSDFFGRTITVQAAEGSSTLAFDSGGNISFNGEPGGIFTQHAVDGIDLRRPSSEFHSEIVLASGTLDNGVLMKSDFRDNRMFGIEFFQANGNSWNTLHNVSR